jgi:hypothetical protein
MAKTIMNQNRYNQMNKKGHKGQQGQPPMGMRPPPMGSMGPGMGMGPRPMMPGGPHGMGGPMGHMMDGMQNPMDPDDMGGPMPTGQLKSLIRFQIKGKRSLDRISVDRNCHFSVDRNCGNQLIEFFDTFHLIEICNNDFDQTPKKLSLDRKFY